MLEAKLSSDAGEFFHAVDTLGTTVNVTPHRAARLDPWSLNSLREKLRIGRRAKIREYRAVHQGVQIADLHHSPRRGDGSRDRGCRTESLAFVASIAQLERIIQRLAVSQSHDPSAAAVPLPAQAGAGNSVSSCDPPTAAAARGGARRSRPRP